MKRISLIIGLMIIFFGTTVMAAPETQSNTKVQFSSPSKAILVKSKSPEFTITLQSNPTTGYSWFLDKYNKQLVEVVSHEFVAPTTNLMGAPGYEVWMFKMLPQAFKIPSTTEISLVYARPWEKNPGQKSTFRIFTVQ